VIAFFVVVFACVPTAADWNVALQANAKCLSGQVFIALAIVNSAVNIITDVLLALLPIPVIIGMSLNKRTKIALSIVMGSGLIAVGAAAVKVRAQMTYLTNPDRLYHDRLEVWAAVELYFGILAASLPTLKPLIAAFLSTARGSHKTSSHNVRRLKPFQAANPNASPNGKQFSSISSGEVYTECASDMPTPSTTKSKDMGGYFSALKKGASAIRTNCSRADSIRLGTVTYTDDGFLERQPSHEHEPEHNSSNAPANGIVRTKTIVTTSEPAYLVPGFMPVAPRPALSRQSSRESGWALRLAQRSEESLQRPRDSGASSVRSLGVKV